MEFRFNIPVVKARDYVCLRCGRQLVSGRCCRGLHEANRTLVYLISLYLQSEGMATHGYLSKHTSNLLNLEN